MNSYNSIIPDQMTLRELEAICGDIETAKNWGMSHATVKLSSNELEYRVDITRKQDYNQELTSRFSLQS